MKEKEIRGFGRKDLTETDPVFPEETLDLGEGMIIAPQFTGAQKPFRTDADKPAGPIPGNMPDRLISGSDGEEAVPGFGMPNFVRFTDSDPDEKTDTGTMLMSETEERDSASGKTGREDMTIDPNATTINSPPDDTDPPLYKESEKASCAGDWEKNGNCSFDTGTVFAPGGNLDEICLSDTDAAESALSSFPDIRTNKKKLISELAFEQEETEKLKTAEDGSAFNLDAADIFSSPGESDFDFVRREDEAEDGTDLLSDTDAETSPDFRADMPDRKTGLADNPDQKMQTDSFEKEISMSADRADTISSFLSENNPDKPQDDADFLGAAFLTEITEEEADPDALTMVMSPSEFEETDLKMKEKTAPDKSEDKSAEKNLDEAFDFSDILQEPEDKFSSEPDIRDEKNTADSFLSEPEDESVFDLDAKTVIVSDSAFGNPDAGEEPIFELGAEAIIDAEEELPLEPGAEAAVTESREEDFDLNAETVVASASDIPGPVSGNLPDPLTEADKAGDEEMDELLIRDADEGLPDLDSILDADSAKEDVLPDDAEDGMSAMDILNSMDSPGAREEYGGADNTIGMLDMLNAENAKQSASEDAFFHIPDNEAKPEPVRKISKTVSAGRTEIKADKKERRKEYPDLSTETLREESGTADMADIKDAKNAAVHTAEREPLYDSIAGKYYFSLSPAQIEGAIERIINRVFSERIEKVLREVVGKAVEEEMKKFRDGFMEDIAEGDKM
ncbi:MAG: hypothetical protein AB7S75_06410 [Desulfococcaceae bacterium]